MSMIFKNFLFFFVLFSPYRFLVESDFATYYKDSSTSSTGTDLLQYVQSYPAIQNYLLIPSPMSHYQVFRRLIFDLLNNKLHQDQIVQILNDFVKVMPKYPPNIVHPFLPSVIKTLKDIAPKVFLVINLVNPDLIPKSSNDKIIDKTAVLIRSILGETKQKNIDDLIEKMKEQLTQEKIIENEDLLAKMFEKLIQNKNISETVLSFLYSLIPIIPNSLLFIQIPEKQTEDLILLIPLSLISPSDINITILSNIQLFKFAYLIIQRIQEKPTTDSIIPLHRLTLSGCSAIEAVIFALRRNYKTITFIRKKAEYEAKVAFGAILNCILTCVEIPELKYFVQENRSRIYKYFTSLCSCVKSLSISKSFQYILTLFNLQGLSPIIHVYSCWFDKPKKFLILHCLRSISPVDPSLPALINEISPLIMQFPFLVCQIAQKVLFSHSVANSSALQHLAMTIEENSGLDDFILFANSIMNHELFFYAIHVISLFNKNPDFKREEVKNAIQNIILVSILTESFYSARHLDRFARWLPFLDEKSLCMIISKCQEEDYRVNCRFILMVTYMPDFARNMIMKAQFFSLFVKHLNKFFIQKVNKLNQNKLNEIADPQFISIFASLCISWHNFYISISEHKITINVDKNISDMFAIGAKTLVKMWKNPFLHNLVYESFCDAVLLEETRKIIISIIGDDQINDSSDGDEVKFIDFLLFIDEASTKKQFPNLQNKNAGKIIERPEPRRWGFSYWYNYAFGQEMSVKI